MITDNKMFYNVLNVNKCWEAFNVTVLLNAVLNNGAINCTVVMVLLHILNQYARNY